jgi:glycogen debranching enzyme
MTYLNKLVLSAILLALASSAESQTPAFPLTGKGLVISRPTQPQQPFTVAGPRGVLVGTQDGQFESWILPVKLLSHLTIEANVEGYSVPIEVNPQSANIEVRPDHTTLTYSHIAFTLRQIMFSPEARVPQVSNLKPGSESASTGPSTGPVVLFQIDSNHPLDLTFRFTPEMRWMWPKRNDGIPGAEWVTDRVPQLPDLGPGSDASPTGYYTLHMDYPDLAGAITIPTATPGILAPYQERPQVHPLELHLHYDPKRDGNKYFPLLMAVGPTRETATNAALGEALARLNAGIPEAYKAHAASYEKLLADNTSIETPDKALNEAFQWGIVSIEQLKTHVPQASEMGTVSKTAADMKGTGFSPYSQTVKTEGALAPDGSPSAQASETALVAGYFASGDSARPGFGWFFGRDSLYTLYAINSFGDFALTRAELEFLIARQREDGKIMHEFAQTAADPSVDWKQFPYMYAAADATPLFLMAMRDYLRTSGDIAFVQKHREAVEKAWSFETAPTSDTDHDGIYDNSQGTGWVESWPHDRMPHQEIYLALLDKQASEAFADLEKVFGNQPKSAEATNRAAKIAATIEQEYYDPEKGCYAFSHNPEGDPNGATDKSSTIYPAIAWWDYDPSFATQTSPSSAAEGSPEGAGTFRSLNKGKKKTGASAPEKRPASMKGTGFSPYINAANTDRASAPETNPLAHPAACLQQWASPTLATDWGLRDVATTEPFYDGMSYHQGSVWPLFTGWGALAEYRANQPLPAEQMLMQNVDLTWAQDPGAVTELLSGDFFVPFGRSTSHQLWSSAMVLTPTLRGLFGINLESNPATATSTITVNPHLPANWDHAEISNIHLGNQAVTLTFHREIGFLRVELAVSGAGSIPILRSDLSGARLSKASARLPILEIPLPPVELELSEQLPTPGSRTSQPKILSAHDAPGKLTATISAPADATVVLELKRNQHLLKVGIAKDFESKNPGATASIDVLHVNDIPIDLRQDGPQSLTLHFPPGQGYQTLEFTLTW